MLYSLVLVTVSAHFTSCLGNNVNENFHFNDFLTEYSYINSVQHRWKLPKSVLQCSCSSEAVTVLSEYFHKVTSITTCSHLHQGCPSHLGGESSPAPPQELLQGPSHPRASSKERTKIILWKQKNALRESSLHREFVGVSFLFLLLVCMCVYIFCKVELQKENMVRGTL